MTEEWELAFVLGSLNGFIDFGGSTIVDRDREAFFGDV